REHDGVGDREHADLALPRADGLDEDEILSCRVDHEQGLQSRLGESAEVPPGTHRADEDVRVEEVVGEPDPVAEQRALGERARRVDRDDADRRAFVAREADERRGEGRLADAGRSGQPDGVGVPRVRVDIGHDVVGERIAVLDDRDRARERASVAGAKRVDEALARPATAGCYAGCSAPSAGCSTRLRASTRAVQPPAAASPAAVAYVQRALAAAVSAPEQTIASAKSALCAEMIAANARPRTRSEVARCTITTVIGNVMPFPSPASTIASAAIQMLGAAAAPIRPSAHGRKTSA